MNKEKVINEFIQRYPGKNIVQNPGEIICEIAPAQREGESGTAVAVIDKSVPHYHRKAVEEYSVIMGELSIFKDGKKFDLKAGDVLSINPGEVHYAEGNETWVKIVSRPGWTEEDHFPINEGKVSERFQITPACYLILIRDGKVLMLRRFNTGYEDGNYSLVAGHVDRGESYRQTMTREAKEEAGIVVDPGDLEVVHVMQRVTDKEGNERIDVFIKADKWEGEANNMEPNKCDDLGWFSIDNLPANTIPCVKHALECINKGVFYSEFGF